MGFHVYCSGAELLHRLRANASGFLGEPYAAYLLALATQVDDEALTWLHRYEMQLDSLCGPYAAFLMFYNDVRLNAEPGPNLWAPSFEEDQGDHDIEHTPWSNDGRIEIELKPSVLNGGAESVDSVLRFDPRAQTHNEVLVTSMTYESDTVARELGMLDQLPCLILFDDPASNDVYTFSLANSDAGTLRDLRTLLSMFLNDSAHSEYLKMLATWHSHNAKLLQLRARLGTLLESVPKRPDYIYAELRRAREMFIVGRMKDFRTTVNLMESKSGNVGRLPWGQLRTITSDATRMLSLSRRILADETAQDHRAKSLEQAQQLARLPASAHRDITVRALQDHVERAAEAAVELILDSLSLGKVEGLLPEPVRQLRRDIDEETKMLQDLNQELASMPRPSLSRHVTHMNRSKRNKSIIKGTQRVLTEASTRIPSILDAVRKGVQLFS
jgi:hypothetical protein